MSQSQTLNEKTKDDALKNPPAATGDNNNAPSVPQGNGDVSAIIKKACLISAGVGIMPIPFFNLAGTTGTQAAMLHMIAKQYGRTFASNVIYNVISSVGGGLVSTFTTTALSRATLMIPYVGIPLAIATRPAINALVTYVLGNAFNSYMRDYHGDAGNVTGDVQKFAESMASRLLSSKAPAATEAAAQEAATA